MVEDDVILAKEVSRGLVEYGIGVDTVENGHDAIVAATTSAFDAVIIDVMLPSTMDGFAVCRELRHRRIGAGIMMLTGRDAVRDRVTGLEAGADDYVVKPFSAPEVVARVRTQLRRLRGPETVQPTLRVGAVELDLEARRCTVDGVEVELTRRQFDLLAALMENRGRVHTREQLLDEVWGSRYLSAKTVDVHIAGLRRQLGDAITIASLRGVGYRLEP